MTRRMIKAGLVAVLVLLLTVIAGCGGGSQTAQRVKGLEPDGVVKTFIESAKDNDLNEASLYVSSTSKNDAKTVINFLTGDSGLDQLKNSNILSVKTVAKQGDYAVVLATLQEQNSIKVSVKPVGLEKVNGEWYILDLNQIYDNARYEILRRLLENI